MDFYAAAMRAEASLSLTPREREIVALVAEGYPSQAIADKLHISLRTVQNHRANAMARTGAKNAADLGRRVSKL